MPNFINEIKILGKISLFSFVLGALAAVVVYYSGLKETLFPTLGKIILVTSIFLGGCYASKVYGNKGLVRGTTVGIMFFIIILIATIIFAPSIITLKNSVYSLLLCIVSGGLGGILGIGLSNN
ncbi:MAG: TIGR04086 family membrane protein [Syntrophomonadaceae bacterium]|nr:TIGR04086 family membrane protein [Syntrophomonadaceae bacterium]